jgi:hypothetical protein
MTEWFLDDRKSKEVEFSSILGLLKGTQLCQLPVFFSFFPLSFILSGAGD